MPLPLSLPQCPPGRNQKGAASTSKSVAPAPSGEAAPLEAPTGNIAGLRSSAEEAEAASSAPAGQTSSEPAWCTDEVSDEGLHRSVEDVLH